MDRERVKAELDRISEANDGLLRPEDVVEFASDPETALHGEFTWDDTEAAREYRLEQARRVIRVVVEIIPQSAEPIRAFVSLVPDRRNRGGGYRPMPDVLENADWREQLLAQALRELQSWRAKYEQLRALAPVFEAMDRIEAKAPAKKQRKAAAVQATA